MKTIKATFIQKAPQSIREWSFGEPVVMPMVGNLEQAIYESPTLNITDITGEFSILKIKLPDGSIGEIKINIKSYEDTDDLDEENFDKEDFKFEENFEFEDNSFK